MLYGEAKRTDEALEYMHRALALNPDNASALNYIGYTWAEKGVNLDEAERMISRAVELKPDDGYIVDSLGWVHYVRAKALTAQGRSSEAQKHLDAALTHLERADQLTGGDPVVSEHLGDTYLLMDQKRHALDRFEEAIRLEPREGEQPELLAQVRDPQARTAVAVSRAALLVALLLASRRLPDRRRLGSRCRRTIRGRRRCCGVAGAGGRASLAARQRAPRRGRRSRCTCARSRSSWSSDLRGCASRCRGCSSQTLAVLVTDGPRYELFRAEDRSFESGEVHRRRCSGRWRISRSRRKRRSIWCSARRASRS